MAGVIWGRSTVPCGGQNRAAPWGSPVVSSELGGEHRVLDGDPLDEVDMWRG